MSIYIFLSESCCTPLVLPHSLTTNSTSSRVGDYVRVSCSEGYTSIQLQQVIQCLKSSEWSLPLIECRGIHQTLKHHIYKLSNISFLEDGEICVLRNK